MAESEILNRKDPLTGFHVKEGLYEYLSTKTQTVYVRASKLIVVILDLDHFKNINDTYGHLVGDDALRFFSVIINKALKGQHFVARYGGDEFVVAIQDTADGKESTEVINRMRSYLRKEKFPTPKGHIRIKSSFGMASFPDDAKTPRGLLDMADQALYYAKTHGRNKAVYSRSLKRHSIWDRIFSLIKMLMITIIIFIVIIAYQGSFSFRGAIGYFRNIYQYGSYAIHKKEKKYNFTSFQFNNGKKLDGWVIKEDPENIVITLTQPTLQLDPRRSEVAALPISVPKSEIYSSINLIK